MFQQPSSRDGAIAISATEPLVSAGRREKSQQEQESGMNEWVWMGMDGHVRMAETVY